MRLDRQPVALLRALSSAIDRLPGIQLLQVLRAKRPTEQYVSWCHLLLIFHGSIPRIWNDFPGVLFHFWQRWFHCLSLCRLGGWDGQLLWGLFDSSLAITLNRHSRR